MIVQELIAALQALPQDAEVNYENDAGAGSGRVEGVRMSALGCVEIFFSNFELDYPEYDYEF